LSGKLLRECLRLIQSAVSLILESARRQLAIRACVVAQVSNLLYRRLPVGKAATYHHACGLEIRDTADWKSALQGSRFQSAERQLGHRACGLEIRDTADWKSALQGSRFQSAERQLGNRACGLEIRDTADWKSALQGSRFQSAERQLAITPAD